MDQNYGDQRGDTREARTLLGIASVLGIVIANQSQQEVVQLLERTGFEQPTFTIWLNHSFLVFMLPLALAVRACRRSRQLGASAAGAFGAIDVTETEEGGGCDDGLTAAVAALSRPLAVAEEGAVCSLCALLREATLRERWGSTRRVASHIVVLAVLYLIPNVLWVYTLTQVTITMFLVITQSVCVFVLLIEAVIHCKMPRPLECCAVAFVVSGVAAIAVTESNAESKTNSLAGILNCVLIAFGYAVYEVRKCLGRRSITRVADLSATH